MEKGAARSAQRTRNLEPNSVGFLSHSPLGCSSPPLLSSLLSTGPAKRKTEKKSPLVKGWRRAEFVFLSDGGVEGCVSTTCQTTISLLTSLLL